MQNTAISKRQGRCVLEPLIKHGIIWGPEPNLCSMYLIIPNTCLVIISLNGNQKKNPSVCNWTAKHTAKPTGKTWGVVLKWPKKRLTHSILHFMAIFWSNPLQSRVCSMYSWVCFSRECRGGLDNVTRMKWLVRYQCASQQLTTMPMIHSQVEILLCGETRKRRLLYPASLNEGQTCSMWTSSMFYTHFYLLWLRLVSLRKL